MSWIHYYFEEFCDNTPQAILAKVELMFKEIAELPYGLRLLLRYRPEIARESLLEGGQRAVVRIRFSLLQENEPELPQFLGLGLAPIKAEGQPCCPVCDSTSCTCGYMKDKESTKNEKLQ